MIKINKFIPSFLITVAIVLFGIFTVWMTTTYPIVALMIGLTLLFLIGWPVVYQEMQKKVEKKAEREWYGR